MAPFPQGTDEWDRGPIPDEFIPSEIPYTPEPPEIAVKITNATATEMDLYIAYVNQAINNSPTKTLPQNYVSDLLTEGTELNTKFQQDIIAFGDYQAQLDDNFDGNVPALVSTFRGSLYEVPPVIEQALRINAGSISRVEGEQVLRVGAGLEPIPAAPWDSQTFLLTLSTQDAVDSTVSPQLEYLKTIQDELEINYEFSGYSTMQEYLEAEVYPIANELYENSQPLGSFSKHQGIFEDSIAAWWTPDVYDPRFGSHIRREILGLAKNIQEQTGVMDRTKLREFLDHNIDAMQDSVNLGIYSALNELNHGPSMTSWLQAHPEIDPKVFLNANIGMSVTEFAEHLGTLFPEFESVRTSGREDDGAIYIPDDLAGILNRLPARLRPMVANDMQQALGVTNAAEFEAKVSGMIINGRIDSFINDRLEEVMVGIHPGFSTYLEDSGFTSVTEAIISLGIPPNTTSLLKIRQVVDEALQPDEDEVALVEGKLQPLLDSLSPTLASALNPLVTGELTEISAATGRSISDLLSDGTFEGVLERGFKHVLGENFREIEILAELQGSSISELLTDIGDSSFTLDEIIEEALNLEEAEVRPGETEDIGKLRGELAKIRGRRTEAEAASDVREDITAEQNKFLADNPELEAQQEQLRQQQVQEQVESGFIREPFRERVQTEVGRGFFGRQRDRIIRELQPQLEEQFVTEFRERNERIRTENENTGAETLGPELSAEEFFNQNVDNFVPDTDRQLGTLRQLQSQDRLVFSGVARRRRNRR